MQHSAPSNSSSELVSQSEAPITVFFMELNSGLEKPWQMLCATQDRDISTRKPIQRNITLAVLMISSSIFQEFTDVIH